MSNTIRGLLTTIMLYTVIMCLAHIILHIIIKMPTSQYMPVMTFFMFILGLGLGGASSAQYIDSGQRDIDRKQRNED